MRTVFVVVKNQGTSFKNEVLVDVCASEAAAFGRVLLFIEEEAYQREAYGFKPLTTCCVVNLWRSIWENSDGTYLFIQERELI